MIATKKKIKTGWIVWIFIIFTAVLLPVQLLTTFDLPLSQIIYALLFVVGPYVGIDQLTSYIATKKMPSGIKYTGSANKLLAITIAMILLMIEMLILQYLEQYAVGMGIHGQESAIREVLMNLLGTYKKNW